MRNGMPECNIYSPTKTSMQSGRANIKKLVLEFVPCQTQTLDPLMGWIGSDDPNQQIKIRFNTKEQAIAFAQKKGLTIKIQEPNRRIVRPKSYSDNFSSKFRFE